MKKYIITIKTNDGTQFTIEAAFADDSAQNLERDRRNWLRNPTYASIEYTKQ